MAKATKRKSSKRKTTAAKRRSGRAKTMAAGRKAPAKRGRRKVAVRKRKTKKSGLRGLLSSLPLMS